MIGVCFVPSDHYDDCDMVILCVVKHYYVLPNMVN